MDERNKKPTHHSRYNLFFFNSAAERRNEKKVPGAIWTAGVERHAAITRTLNEFWLRNRRSFPRNNLNDLNDWDYQDLVTVGISFDHKLQP
jgi:hypothetical protein